MPEYRYRTCPRCADAFPATSEYFYEYGTGRLEYCNERGNDCHRTYWRERSRRRRQRARLNDSPLERRFGVEIEFIGDWDDCERALRMAGVLPVQTEYGHRVSDRWRIVPDGSIDEGGEVVSPPLGGADAKETLRQVMDKMRDAVEIDGTCGLHVHHEVVDLEPGHFHRLYRFWFQMAPLIDGLVSPSRRGGRWCKPLNANDLALIESVTDMARDRDPARALRYMDRYKVLNAVCYPRQGTVEARQHQGTLNPTKALAWIELGQATIAWAKSADSMPDNNYAAMFRSLRSHGMTEDVSDFLTRRARELARRGGTRLRERQIEHQRLERERAELPVWARQRAENPLGPWLRAANASENFTGVVPGMREFRRVGRDLYEVRDDRDERHFVNRLGGHWSVVCGACGRLSIQRADDDMWLCIWCGHTEQIDRPDQDERPSDAIRTTRRPASPRPYTVSGWDVQWAPSGEV